MKNKVIIIKFIYKLKMLLMNMFDYFVDVVIGLS